MSVEALILMLKRLSEFFFDKALEFAWEKSGEKFGSPGLKLEIPSPRNPMGRHSIAGTQTPSWSVKLRFIAQRKPRDIVELHIDEDGVGGWHVDEVFREQTGPVSWPIRVNMTDEFWIRVRSPRSFPTLPIEVGRLTLKVRDHTQSEGQFRSFTLTQTATRIDR